jgi:hypothetical protein
VSIFFRLRPMPLKAPRSESSSGQPAPEETDETAPDAAPAADDFDDDDDDDEEEDEEDEEESDIEIAYDFNAMGPAHLNPVMNLLDYFLPGPANPEAVEALAQAVLACPYTTVMCSPADEDEGDAVGEVHGVVSLLDLGAHAAALRPLLDLLAVLDDRRYFGTLAAKGGVGLVVAERVAGPKEIGAQLMVNLFEEYLKDPERPRFDTFVVLGRMQLSLPGDKDDPPPAKKRRPSGTPRTACMEPEEVTEDKFRSPEHWAWWRHRATEAPFLTLRPGSIIPRTSPRCRTVRWCPRPSRRPACRWSSPSTASPSCSPTSRRSTLTSAPPPPTTPSLCSFKRPPLRLRFV